MSTDTLAGALAAAQAEIRNPALDGVNPHFKSRFATLGACLRAVRPVLSKHGIALIQEPYTPEAGAVGVRTTLLHAAGSASSEVWCRCGPKPQDLGSAVTYLRRYALCAMVGIVGDDDDDGNDAQRAADEAFDRQVQECRALLRELGAKTAAQAHAIVQEATEGAHGVDDVATIPGNLIDALQEWRDIAAQAAKEE